MFATQRILAMMSLGFSHKRNVPQDSAFCFSHNSLQCHETVARCQTNALVNTSMALCLLTALSVANAASFDCKQARSDVEKMVCSDTELSSRDEQLAAAYKAALDSAKTEQDKARIRASQREWIAVRDACDSLPCLRDRYQQRYAILLEGSPHGIAKAFQIIQNDSNWPEASRMCQDFEQNLNEFPALPPMVCERSLSRKFPQFRRPSWREWNEEEIWRRRGVLKQVDEIAFPRPLAEAPRSDADWDRVLERQLGAKQIRVREATDIPAGGQFERWVLYEAARLPESPDPYTQLQNCTQHRRYVGLTADGRAVAQNRANRLSGNRDFLIYRDMEQGEIVFMEGWNVWPGFENAELRVADVCVIQYRYPNGGQK